MVINPIVGVYIPIIRIPIKGGMTLAHMPPSYFKPKGFNKAAARSVVAAAKRASNKAHKLQLLVVGSSAEIKERGYPSWMFGEKSWMEQGP